MSFLFTSLGEVEKEKKYEFKVWDSYFSHHCSIGLDADVLISDIDDRKSFVGIRRWWYNLFLVSYDIGDFNSNCISSTAIKIDRARQFRSYGFRIHPFSPFKRVWDRMTFVVTILNICFITLLSSCLYVTRDSRLHNCGVSIAMALEIIAIADVFLNFKTGYTEKNLRYVEFDQAWISMNYLASTILVHFVSAIPWLVILKLTNQLTADSGYVKVQFCTTFRSVVCVASLGRLYRLFEIIFYRRPRCVRSSDLSLTKHCLFIFLVGVVFVHVLTCLHVALSVILEPFSSHTGERSPAHKVGIYIHQHYDPFELYVISFQKTAQIFFSTHNFIGHPDTNLADKISFIVTLMIGWLFYMWVAIEIMALIQQQNFGQNFVLKRVQRAGNMVRARALPDRLEERVRAYFAVRAVREEAALWDDAMHGVLPLKMRNELTVAMHRPLLRRLPLFRYWSAEIIDELALSLRGEKLLPGDVIVTDAFGGGRFYIVESGRLRVWHSESESEWSEVGEGAHFVCRRGRALAACALHYLSLAVVRRLLRPWPDLQDQFADYIAQ